MLATRLSSILLVGCSLLGLAPAAPAQSNGPGERPAVAKAQRIEAFRVAPGTIAPARIRLGAPDPATIEGLRQANRQSMHKRLEIGIGRDLPPTDAGGATATWSPAGGGRVTHWEVTSAEARALRVEVHVAGPVPGMELRFAGSANPGVVYGPFTPGEMLAGGHWSPVVEGETATVELFVPAASPDPRIALGRVSHLFASPADPKVESVAKAAQACQVNFACRASTDADLAQTGRSVARMTFISGPGGSALCTGTLLNPTDGSFTPYFFGAAHCFATQGAASTLTTHWFDETTTCTGTTRNPSYTQVPGGARLLYANETSDVLFLRLNNPAPAAAVFAGWDAARVTPGAAVTAIHHPAGDYKKVSIGRIAGLDGSQVIPAGTFIRVRWDSTTTGFTEGGSSGGGIFTGGPGVGYRFRGGLLGGPDTTCTSPPSLLFDHYSRFDLAFPFIAQFLSPANAPALGANAVANPGFEGGGASWTETTSGTTPIIINDPSNARAGSWYAWLGGAANLTDTLIQGLAVPAGAARLQFWYRITTDETAAGEFDVLAVAVVDPSTGEQTVARFSNRDAAPGWAQSPVIDLSAWGGRTVQLRFRATNDFSLPTSFRVDDVTLNGTAVSTTTNATALWWNAQESGWGLNVNQQGGKAFATLFTYDSTGAPMWLVMPDASRQQGAETFSGALYRTTGSPFNTNPFPPITGANITRVGDMTLDFAAGPALLGYSVDGVFVSKAVEKQLAGVSCQPTTASRAAATNYTDLWYNAAESGWGINLTHQGNTIFATLFTYGANGQGLWLVMPNGARQGDGSFSGELYQTNGPAFSTQPWTSIGFAAVGTMRLRFQNGEAGTLDYSVSTVPVTKAIARQVFGNPVPACSG